LGRAASRRVTPRRPKLLEVGVLGADLAVELVGGREAGLHHLLREGAQLRAGSHQAAQGGRVLQVVLRGHHRVGGGAGIGQRSLVGLRQGVPLLDVDHGVDGRAAFPPAGIVVERRHLVEAELLVVIGADPLGGVDRALLQRRIDVAAGDLLRHDAELGEHLAGDAGDAHLQALQVGDGLDLLAEPAAHLGARVAGRHRVDVVLLVELVEELVAAALEQPGVLLRALRPKGTAVPMAKVGSLPT
jgi:hypothetical protein